MRQPYLISVGLEKYLKLVCIIPDNIGNIERVNTKSVTSFLLELIILKYLKNRSGLLIF